MPPVARRIFYIAILLLGLGWTVLSRPAAGSTTAGRTPAPQIGFPAPDFTLTDLSGQAVDLSGYQGQVVVLNFWACWCPPCRAEMPAFEQVYRTYRDRGLVVLAVNASFQDPPAQMEAFLDTLAYSYPVLRDESGAVNRLYSIGSLPTTFFIGRDGTIRDLVVGGPMTEAGIAARVETLLQEVP